MSNYSKTTDFEAKDSLPTGDSGKIIRGAEFETEFDAISTAIATKADTAGPTFTGTLTFETISDGTIGVTAFVDEDNMASNSATLVPTQQSVKAYVDSQVTAQDLDFQADTGGALSIDLDSETMTFTGGTGIDTSGLGNAVTFAIDSTVATLTGSQTLTNKTLTSPVLNTGVSGTAVLDEDNMASNSATQLATQQSIKAYVDSQVGANNELSEILANGNTTGGTNIVFGDSASVSDDRLVFGAGSDLQIYHSGVHSYIDDAGTGNLTLRGNASVRVEKYEGEILADFAADGAVSLYHDNSVKIATTSTGVNVTGNVAVSGTVDGRDVATDGTKLDGIEAGATADQTAAEIRTLVEAATDSNVFTDADHSKLDGIEALADVTDTTNVTAAGALMDSELTSEASVKALNQGVATTDSPTFDGLTIDSSDVTLATIQRDGGGSPGSFGGYNIKFNAANSTTGDDYYLGINLGGQFSLSTDSSFLSSIFDITSTGINVNTNINFGDNDKAVFGAGSDLQIYHSGTTSFITENGIGDLRIGGNNLLLRSDDIFVQSEDGTANAARFNSTTGVTLYRAGAAKLATTSLRHRRNRVLQVTADALTVQTVQGNIEIANSAAIIDMQRAGTNYIYASNASGNLRLGSGGSLNRINITAGGDISFYEDTGTTAKFFWDASAESLGIGTTDPWETLSIPFNEKLSFGSSTYPFSISRSSSGELITTFEDGYSSSSARIDFKMANGTKTPLSLLGSGNVGIGTSSPAEVLNVKTSSGNSYVDVERATQAQGEVGFKISGGTSGADWFMYQPSSSDDLRFYKTGDKVTIDSSGNLLVGTTDKPSASVHGGTMISRDLDSEANKTSTSATTGVTHFVFFNPNGSVGSISTSGSATSYNTSSDQRLKDNIVDAPSSSDDIDAIQVRSFDWKADGSHQKYGMIAQELQSVAPEAVSGDADSDEMMGVDYSKLVPMLVKEIQSLRARVAELENN
jgi:hypothetical protein